MLVFPGLHPWLLDGYTRDQVTELYQVKARLDQRAATAAQADRRRRRA